MSHSTTECCCKPCPDGGTCTRPLAHGTECYSDKDLMRDFINPARHDLAAKDAEIVRLKVAHAGLMAALMDIIARGNEGRGVGRMIETAEAALTIHGAA